VTRLNDGDGGKCRFTPEEVTGQNQVKASVQRKIRQSIADEVCTSPPSLRTLSTSLFLGEYLCYSCWNGNKCVFFFGVIEVGFFTQPYNPWRLRY
jgi:hypothetical protein